MSAEPPFNGQLGTLDPRSAKIIWIRVLPTDFGEVVIKLYNAPPPFSINTLVGTRGTVFQIRRVRRGWIYSTFIITFFSSDGSADIEYKGLNNFGDLLAKYTGG